MPQVITEFAQLLVDNDDRFNQKLDAASQQQKLLHVQSLTDSLRKHDAVREAAERVQQQIQFELQAEQVRRDQEQLRKLAEAKAKLAAEEQAHLKRLEEERRKEEERKQREAQLQREREDAARRQKEEAEQKARQKAAEDKEAEDKKQRERQAEQQAQAQAQQARQQQQQQEAQARQQQNAAPPQSQAQTQPAPSAQAPKPTAQPAPAQLAALQSAPEQRAKEHQAFMAMKQELKQSVARLDAAKQQDPWLKKNLGDSCRRRIRTLIGQVNKHNKVENTRVVCIR